MTQEFVLTQTQGRKFKFKGQLLGKAKTSTNRADSNFSGRTGIWEEYRIYKTTGGNYVCEAFKGTQWQGCHSTTELQMHKSVEDIVGFFENKDLLNELLENAKIPFEVEID